MKKLYVISGCNGAGKTTASYTILPEILDCREFVNADEIARGLSPFQPEKVNIQAGKLMLSRINKLLNTSDSFAIETTLSTKSYSHFINKAKQKGYTVYLLFFWLDSPALAISRVKMRVKEGGHHIPEDVIRRRYERGLSNFFNIYMKISDSWIFINNSSNPFEIIAEGESTTFEIIKNTLLWQDLNDKVK